MKKLTLISTIFFTAIAGLLNAQLELPQPSPWAQVSQKIGLTKATVTYSRPSMRGRKIFDELVPFNEMWRTGANAATKLEFDHDVMINNQKIAAGAYSLLTIPNQNEWTIIINRNTEPGGTSSYKQEEDVMRFTVKPENTSATESFTIDFANITQKNATMQLYWENTKVSFPIVTDYMQQAQQNIKDAIADMDNGFGVYESSAEFYLDNNLDKKQALDWAKKSVEMSEKFWNVSTLARAYAENGMYADAVKTAERSLELARQANNKQYIDLNTKNIEDWKKNL
jgi:hypothetical protein